MRRRRPNSRTNGVPEKKKVQKTSSVEESKKKESYTKREKELLTNCQA